MESRMIRQLPERSLRRLPKRVRPACRQEIWGVRVITLGSVSGRPAATRGCDQWKKILSRRLCGYAGELVLGLCVLGGVRPGLTAFGGGFYFCSGTATGIMAQFRI